MLALERKQIDADALQNISQKSVVVKYKAELAQQSYVAAVGAANRFKQQELTETYLPCLDRLWSLEKERLDFA